MKKIILAVLSIVCAAALMTGCMAQTTVSVFGGSYFLTNPDMHGVGNINETAEYKVTFEKGSNEDVDLSVDDASYVMHAYTSEYEGNTCYRLDTTFTLKGKYVVGGEDTPVEDSITTTAYFLGLDNAFKTLYSERNVKSHSVVYDDGKYEVKYYEYSLATTYGEKDATVTFTPDSAATTGSYSLSEGETTYKDIFKSNYFDNETILFVIRSFRLSTSFSTTFDSIDGISKTKRTLFVSSIGSTTDSASSTAKETLDLSYTQAGERITKVDTYKLNFAVSGTFSGSYIVLNYSDPDGETKKIGQQLIRMQTSLPYSVGTLTYLISNVTKY